VAVSLLAFCRVNGSLAATARATYRVDDAPSVRSSARWTFGRARSIGRMSVRTESNPSRLIDIGTSRSVDTR